MTGGSGGDVNSSGDGNPVERSGSRPVSGVGSRASASGGSSPGGQTRGLHGWVANMPDGSVTFLAEGRAGTSNNCSSRAHRWAIRGLRRGRRACTGRGRSEPIGASRLRVRAVVTPATDRRRRFGRREDSRSALSSDGRCVRRRSVRSGRAARSPTLGESVEDEWQYVNDLLIHHGRPPGARGTTTADAVRRPAGSPLWRPSTEVAPSWPIRTARSTGSRRCRRRSAWRSSCEPDGVRFQDAARTASHRLRGIQADPLVARVAALLAEATPAELVMARAVMNGSDRSATWRTMFPTLSRRPRRPERRELAGAARCLPRGRRARRAVAEPVPRRDRRGADRPPARPAGRAAAVRRERRVLFDGVPAEIHPYDVTVERQARAEVFDCKWGARGINADVLHQLDDARRHAAAEDVRVFVALVLFDGGARAEVRLARRRRRGGNATVHARVGRSAGREVGNERGGAVASSNSRIPGAVRRVRARRAAPGAGLLRWAQDCAWIHSERLGFHEVVRRRGDSGGWCAARSCNVLADVAMGETTAVTTTMVG